MSFAVILARRIKKLLVQHRFDQALVLQEEHRDLCGVTLENQGFLLEGLLGARKLEDAQTLGNMLCQQFPHSARIFYLNAKAHYYLKKYVQAQEFIQIHLELFPNSFGKLWFAKCLIGNLKFDEAFSTLNRLDLHNSIVLQELGWLFERQRQYAVALDYYRKAIGFEKNDRAYLSRKVQEMEAALVDKDQLVEEMELLEAFDEEIPEHLLPAFFKSNLEKGEHEKMRAYFRGHTERFSTGLSKSIGWVCYFAKCHDLAFELFLRCWTESQSEFKLMNALQYSARMCGKTQVLIDAFKMHCRQNPKLYGRIRTLEKELFLKK